MSASGLAVASTKASLGISSQQVVDIRSSENFYNALPAHPVYGDMLPFTCSFTPSSVGVVVVNVSAYAIADSGTPTFWYLGLDINNTLFPKMIGQTRDAVIQYACLSFQYTFPVNALAPQTITLKGSQSGTSGDEGIEEVSWTVMFYPS
jgi:hypothetical protein